jgi:hypothetical protein
MTAAISMESFAPLQSKLQKHLYKVELHSEGFAMEGINVAAFQGMFKSLVDSVKATVNHMSSFLNFEKVGRLTIEPKKFSSTMHSIPYTAVGEMSAVVPEGLKGTFLEAIEAVEKCVDHIPSGIRMLDEYEAFLAQFISDKKFNNASYDDKKVHLNAEKTRMGLYAGVGKVFTTGSYKTKQKVKDVVKRNGDWEIIMTKTNEMVSKLEGIDREAIQRKINQCSAYLEIISGDFQKEKDRKVSSEAAQRLGNMAHSVAKEMEFFSLTYFRTLSLQGAVQNTSEAIHRAVG